jgi:tetratricopeptide (TPR) repeat protein
MAAYYALRSDYRLGVASDSTLPIRLRQLADRAPDRERLLIRSYWSSLNNDPAILAVADSLVTRYPSEPDGHLFLGTALSLAGQYFDALPYLRRVIAMDSLSFQNPASHCRACDAISTTIATLLMLDSFPAAERLARERIHRQPDSHVARWEYTRLLEFGGSIEEAAASAADASSFAPGDPYANVFRSMLHIREGRFEDADRTLVQLAASGPANLRSEALWFLSLSLRYQGRLREAIDAARSMRSIHSTVREDGSRDHTATHPEAQALFELGRAGEAAALYERLSVWRGQDVFADLPWILARNRVWYLTHQATALAAGGDTARLPALIDTLEATGRLSLLGRDRRLHHYARGLLLAARGDTAGAAASFYRATYLPVTPVTPFARINLEYGRMLVALGRAEEAVRTLQPALRGPLEAGNFYSTHTEIREMLGRAWEMAGQPDSAIVHYRRVLNAWKNADPEFHARRDTIRRRLDRLLASG